MTPEGDTGLVHTDPGAAPTSRPEHKSREKDEDRATRKPLDLWDRIKLILLFCGAWLVMLWAAVAQFDPHISARAALNQTLRSYGWILALAGLEAIRQSHYLVSEHSARYHRFWTKRVFGRFEKRVGRMNDWTRFRISRVLKVLFVVLIIDLALAKIYHLPPATALIQLPIALTSALPFIFQLAFSFFFIIFQFVGLFWFLSRGGIDVYMPDDIDKRYSDVWGQDNVLAKVKENMVFLEDPESIEEKGGYVPRGILLWGPPGTGKTLMAKAVAGETGKPFVYVDPGAFIQMFMGVGILKVKGLFRKLRRLAVRYGGVIVFFDEADSLGNRGALPGQGGPPGGGGMSAVEWPGAASCHGTAYLSESVAATLFRMSLEEAKAQERRGTLRDRIIMGGFGGGGMGTLNALLSELSGLEKPRGFFNRIVRRALGMRPKPPPKYRILVMMATNMPQALDPALLRPGRIDRIYKVGYPSKAGRIRTYDGYFAKVKHNITPEEIDKLATITPYATGATIEDLVNEALIQAIGDGRDAIEWRDVMKAKQLKDLGPPEDVEYIERERHAVAVHEACHAVVAYRVRRHMTIDIATIEKGGTYLGMVASIPPEDQFTFWRSTFESDIMVSLASLAGERMFFQGDSSSGVAGDLEAATTVATLMEGYWGMGSTVASHGVTHRVGIRGGGKPGLGGDDKDKDFLEGSLGRRIEERLGELLTRTEALLAENRRAVLCVAHALETQKTVSGDDVVAVIEGQQGPLVDGRAYETANALERLEAYHEEAVEAHRTSSKVKTSLPTLPGISGASPAEGNGEIAGETTPALEDGPPPSGEEEDGEAPDGEIGSSAGEEQPQPEAER
jgi:ATP-dependent Zn protease